MILQLPHDVEAAALARAFVTDHGHGLAPDRLSDAVLLVSETVANAVRHGQPAITVEIRTHPPGIGVAVHDHDPTVPTLPDGQPDPTSPSRAGTVDRRRPCR